MQYSQKSSNQLAKYAKWSACLYVVVSRALVPLGFVSGRMQSVLLLFAVLMTVYMDRWMVRIPSFLYVEIVFIAITSASSLMFAKSLSWSITAIQTMIYGLLFGYVLFRVSIVHNSIDWFINSWIIAAIIMCGYVFFTGGYSVGRLVRVSANEGMNSNTLGVFMMFAVWAVLYLLSKRILAKRVSVPILVGGLVSITAFLYIIIETGSRKSFLASVFLLLFWIVFAMRPVFRRLSFNQKLTTISVIIVVLTYIVLRFGTAFLTSADTLRVRMQMMSSENLSDMNRIEMVKDAFGVFKSHPIFGVGWNNYRLYSFAGTYSHCSYVEVLACTGIIGASIFYYWLYIAVRNAVKFFREKKRNIVSINLMALVLVFLFINLVQIMFYNTYLLMIWHLVFIIPLVQEDKIIENVDE